MNSLNLKKLNSLIKSILSRFISLRDSFDVVKKSYEDGNCTRDQLIEIVNELNEDLKNVEETLGKANSKIVGYSFEKKVIN
jgi:uncharacterized phage infection (PIP) family protein YhgE